MNSEQDNPSAELFKEQLAVGAAQAEHKELDFPIGSVPYTLVPEGYEVITHERLLEEYSTSPARLKQDVVLRDPKSFTSYMKNHATDSSVIFCDADTMRFTGILDYHNSTQAHHCEHTAVLQLEQTPELETWRDNDKKIMTQIEFARFIEDNAPEIIASELDDGIKTPSGSDMLQIALTLSRTEKAAFRSANRLDNGQTQFKFEQNFDDKAGENGELTIPEMIKIGLPLFKSADPAEGYAIKARFRYRIQSGELKMWYELVRPERIIEDAVNVINEELVKGLQDKSFAFYHGRF